MILREESPSTHHTQEPLSMVIIHPHLLQDINTILQRQGISMVQVDIQMQDQEGINTTHQLVVQVGINIHIHIQIQIHIHMDNIHIMELIFMEII